MTDLAQSPQAAVNVVALPNSRGAARPSDDRRVGFLAGAVVAVFAAGAVAGGLYDFSRWGLLGIGLLAVLAGLAIAGRLESFGPLTPALAALVALAGWAAASMLWADSPGRAWTESNRLVLYAAALAVLGATLRTRRDARRSLAIVGGAIALAALWTAGALLIADPGAFLDHRLDAPIGYINGSAGLFLMGLWPLLAFADRGQRPSLVGVAMGLAVVEANHLVLTQSRAIVPALAIGVLLVVALFPGRLRRIWMLLIVAAGVAAAAPWTLAIYADRIAGEPRAVPDHLAQGAGLASLAAALAAGLAWYGLTVLSRRERRRSRRRVAAAGAGTVIVGLLAVTVGTGDPVHRVQQEWRAFTSLEVDETARTRFTGTGGFRYDLWRVALDDLKRRPLLGVGAGSYGLSYYQQRRQLESVRQPHSLPLQILGELGLVGAALALSFLVAAFVALLRNAGADVGAAIAGLGIVIAWGVQTSMDWLYNLPGLSCIAIVGLVAACGPGRGRSGPDGRRRRTWLLVAGAIATAIAAASLGRQFAADRYAAAAGGNLARDPQAALADTTRSLALNPHALETYFTRAAAFARFDEYDRARDVLMQAARREPLNFVPWALVGDLAVRSGDMPGARTAYRRALALSPRDPALAELAADPRAALR